MQDKHDQKQEQPKRGLKSLITGERELNLAEKVLLVGLGVLACLVAAMIILYFALVRPPHRQPQEGSAPTTVVEQTDEATGQTHQVEVPLSHRDGFYNILICGTDESGLRTDTIMIARMNTEDHSTALISIPRDTLCSRPDSEEAVKLNSIYAFGGLRAAGMEKLMNELEIMLGFRVDGYMLIHLNAFVEVVDLMNGVEYDVPEDMFYEDPSQNLYIDLKAGLQHLDGDQAMQLCRFRGYPTADIQRCSVQQDFLCTLATQCLDNLGFSDIQKIVEICRDYVTTDLSIGNLIYFGREMLNCDFKQTEMHTMPGTSANVYGASYWILDVEKSLTVINEWLNPYDYPLTNANLHIRTE